MTSNQLVNCIGAALDEKNYKTINYLNRNSQWETLVAIIGQSRKDTDMITLTCQILDSIK